jgi:hypothetical protein
MSETTGTTQTIQGEEATLRISTTRPAELPAAELTVKIEFHPNPLYTGDRTIEPEYIFGISNVDNDDTPSEGPSGVSVETVLQAALALYTATAEQLLSDVPDVQLRNKLLAVIADKLGEVHQDFAGIVESAIETSGWITELRTQFPDGDLNARFDGVLTRVRSEAASAGLDPDEIDAEDIVVNFFPSATPEPTSSSTCLRRPDERALARRPRGRQAAARGPARGPRPVAHRRRGG